MAPSTRSRKKATSATPLASTAEPPVPEVAVPGSLPPEEDDPGNHQVESNDSESVGSDANSAGYQSAAQEQAEQDALLAEVDARTFPRPSPPSVTASSYSGTSSAAVNRALRSERSDQATPVASKVVSRPNVSPMLSENGSNEDSAHRSVEQIVRVQLMEKAMALMQLANAGDFVAPQGNFDFLTWAEQAIDSNDLTREINVPKYVKAVKTEPKTPVIPEARDEHAYEQPNAEALELQGEVREAIFAPREDDEPESAYHHRLQIQADVLDNEGGIFSKGANALRAEVKGKAKAGSSKEDPEFGHKLAEHFNMLKRDEEQGRMAPQQFTTPPKRATGIVINEPQAPSKPAKHTFDMQTPTRVPEGRPLNSGLGASSTPQKGMNRDYRAKDFDEYYHIL
ncbi:unnamed protein product [Peniophora sp. CBMAI 1063]|nr:unnamed protein product [Peniophora sp. CBMAI 1063]